MTAQQTQTHCIRSYVQVSISTKVSNKNNFILFSKHEKTASSNRSCINTQAKKQKTPFRNCLLLTDVKYFPSEKFGTYPKWKKSTFEIVFSYVIICFECVLCTNMKYYPNPNHYPFSKFRFNLGFGGSQ